MTSSLSRSEKLPIINPNTDALACKAGNTDEILLPQFDFPSVRIKTSCLVPSRMPENHNKITSCVKCETSNFQRNTVRITHLFVNTIEEICMIYMNTKTVTFSHLNIAIDIEPFQKLLL